jgi:hypothetical protein
MVVKYNTFYNGYFTRTSRDSLAVAIAFIAADSTPLPKETHGVYNERTTVHT